MPYAPHVLLTLSGVFGTASVPLEQWSIGLRFEGPLGAPVAVYVAEAARARTLWNTHIRPVQTSMQALTRTRVAFINESGHVPIGPSGAYIQGDDNTVVQGGFAAAQHQPFQTALVVSLNTLRAGPSGKGRVFAPWPGTTVGTDGRITEVNAGNYATSWAAFINALRVIGTDADPNTPDTGLGNLLVASRKGFNSPVTSIRVGTVPDTMRSRRGSLQEGYVTRPLA